MTATVCIFSAAHGRYAVTELVLEQRRRLVEELNAAGTPAVSLVLADDENLDIARALGHEAVEHPNEPLGAKCSEGLRLAARMADVVVWSGSDDWIHPDALSDPVPRAAAEVRVGQRFCLVDLPRGRLTRSRSHSIWGAVPWLVDARLLRAGHDPIRADLDRGLDGALVRGIRHARVPWQFRKEDPHEFRCVDFKTAENLHPYRRLSGGLGLAPEEDAWEALRGWYPADLVERARRLSEEARWPTST